MSNTIDDKVSKEKFNTPTEHKWVDCTNPYKRKSNADNSHGRAMRNYELHKEDKELQDALYDPLFDDKFDEKPMPSSKEYLRSSRSAYEPKMTIKGGITNDLYASQNNTVWYEDEEEEEEDQDFD